MEGFIKPALPNINDVTDALKDFGFFHDLPTVIRMYAEYVNNKQYGYEGGVIDQPDEYWVDMSTMRLLKLWVENAKDLPRLEQISVFETLRNDGRLMGTFTDD